MLQSKDAPTSSIWFIGAIVPIPSKLWQSIPLDFIIDLRNSKGFNTILTVADRHTKMAHCMPYTKEVTSE